MVDTLTISSMSERSSSDDELELRSELSSSHFTIALGDCGMIAREYIRSYDPYDKRGLNR
jgi:hypothetical protein